MASKKKASRVPPVPRGFGTVTPYLGVAGAAEAIEFYKKAFGAKEIMRNPGPDGKIMHARIRIGDSLVMVSDHYGAPEGGPAEPTATTTTTLHIYTKDVDSMWAKAVAAGAKVDMPLDDTFWGERYGQLIDPFGHRWSLSMQVKMSKEEKAAKQKEAMAMMAAGEHPGRET